jgi:hypothetical protein
MKPAFRRVHVTWICVEATKRAPLPHIVCNMHIMMSIQCSCIESQVSIYSCKIIAIILDICTRASVLVMLSMFFIIITKLQHWVQKIQLGDHLEHQDHVQAIVLLQGSSTGHMHAHMGLWTLKTRPERASENCNSTNRDSPYPGKVMFFKSNNFGWSLDRKSWRFCCTLAMSPPVTTRLHRLCLKTTRCHTNIINHHRKSRTTMVHQAPCSATHQRHLLSNVMGTAVFYVPLDPKQSCVREAHETSVLRMICLRMQPGFRTSYTKLS